MSWLIGIICVVIVVYFWRLFLPLGLVVGVIVGLIALYFYMDDKSKAEEKAREFALLKQKISTAQSSASSQGNKWNIYYEPDPANGKKVARYAQVKSNDGLCFLIVQKRINGSRLTGLDCQDIKISPYDNIEVKFDNFETSDEMRLEKYNVGDGVYIPSYQYSYSDELSYDQFIKRLTGGKAVSIRIPSAGGFWTTFSLNGSSEAINELGKQQTIAK